MALSLVSVLSLTAMSNYQRYRRYVRDTAANMDVRNAMIGLQAAQLASEDVANFWYSLSGPAEAPAPVAQIRASSGVQLVLGHLDFSGSFGSFTYSYSYRYAQGYHQRGCYYYLRMNYYLTINEVTNEYNYNYKLPYWNRPSDCAE